MNKEEFIDTLKACYFGDRGAFNKILKEYEELHNKIDKAIEALDGIRKIIETEKRLMGYAIYDSCLLLIEEQLDKEKDLKDSDVDE